MCFTVDYEYSSLPTTAQKNTIGQTHRAGAPYSAMVSLRRGMEAGEELHTAWLPRASSMCTT